MTNTSLLIELDRYTSDEFIHKISEIITKVSFFFQVLTTKLNFVKYVHND